MIRPTSHKLVMPIAKGNILHDYAAEGIYGQKMSLVEKDLQ